MRCGGIGVFLGSNILWEELQRNLWSLQINIQGKWGSALPPPFPPHSFMSTSGLSFPFKDVLNIHYPSLIRVTCTGVEREHVIYICLGPTFSFSRSLRAVILASTAWPHLPLWMAEHLEPFQLWTGFGKTLVFSPIVFSPLCSCEFKGKWEPDVSDTFTPNSSESCLRKGVLEPATPLFKTICLGSTNCNVFQKSNFHTTSVIHLCPISPCASKLESSV